VVVDNRPGASGIIGFEAIAKAAPDGYTLGYQIFSFMTNPSAYVKLPYDTEKDFQPVVRQGANAGLMTVTPSLPVKSVRELIDYARAHPGKLSYGATGATSTNALGMDLFKVATGTQIVQVLYKGIQQAITDTIAGQVHIVCDSMSSIAPHVHAGCLRALGVTTVKRLPIMPDMPTIAEAGLPGFEIGASNGYLLPARAPRDIVLRLNAEMNKALVSPAVSEKFLANGSLVGGGTPELFADYLRRETVKWAGAIKAAGIKPH
jgi:tripartite-type tricarboxylate transporter receptor subunit TctC